MHQQRTHSNLASYYCFGHISVPGRALDSRNMLNGSLALPCVMMSKSRKTCAGARGRDEQLGKELDICSMYAIHKSEQVCQRFASPRLRRILSSAFRNVYVF